MQVFSDEGLGWKKAVVGMLHAPPLPGSPGYAGDWQAVADFVLRDARALVEGGVDGLMLENFGDVPFFKGDVPVEVVACLTRLACAVKAEVGNVPLGINVLRNDGESALAVAMAAGADYVRVNALSGAVVTDQGVIQADAARLMRRRREMGAEDVAVWGDVRVKHAAPLGGGGWRPWAEDVAELVLRAGAGALIVSGPGTGLATDVQELAQVRSILDGLGQEGLRLWVGSGASAQTAAGLLEYADGLIVGMWVKDQQRLGMPVDVLRVRELMRVVRGG